VNLQKLTFVLLLLPILVGCDAGFNIDTGKTKVAELKECYEAMKAKADSTKLRTEYPDGNINKLNYGLASEVASKWIAVACQGI
jgi:hypothetical protein